MDRFGRATPLTMFSLFEETAFTHCEESGFDVYRLREDGLGWVLLHGTCRMERYPAYQEHFTVQTRVLAARRFYGLREFLVRDEAGGVIGSCRTTWAFYDVERRRPVPIPQEMLEVWCTDTSIPLSRETPRLDPPGPAAIDPIHRYRVRISDIDTNGHVNNVNYLGWALESVPQEIQDRYILSLIQGVYRHQVTYGQTVAVATEERSGDGDAERAYSMSLFAGRPDAAAQGSQDPVAYARTEWTPAPSPN